MKNRSLKNDLKKILSESKNVCKVSKGFVSEFSIDIEFDIPKTYSSYIYYENRKNRDLDFEDLKNFIYYNCNIEL